MDTEPANDNGMVWVVVQSKIGQERRAARELERAFEVYLPMKICERHRFGKTETLALPFIPRYLFARVSMRVDDWKMIFRTLGVQTVLGGLRPVAVQDWVIRRIQAAEDAGFIRMGLEGGAPPPPIAARTPVKVDIGTCDLEGLFLEAIDENRALILVSLCQRDSRITVDLRRIKAQAT